MDRTIALFERQPNFLYFFKNFLCSILWKQSVLRRVQTMCNINFTDVSHLQIHKDATEYKACTSTPTIAKRGNCVDRHIRSRFSKFLLIFSFTLPSPLSNGPTAVLQLRRHTQQNSVTHVSITTKSSTVVHSVVWYSIHDDGKLFLTASWIDRDRLSAFPGTH
jgi:hypothetical protein